jgi:hypothetical protein
MHSAGTMLSSALSALNRPYSGSLRRAENITREDLPQNADRSQQKKDSSCVLCFRARDEFLLFQFIDCRQSGNLVTSRLSDIAAAATLLFTSLLAATLTLLSGGFQLAVALSVNLDLSACKHVLRCHVADRLI